MDQLHIKYYHRKKQQAYNRSGYIFNFSFHF
ncbi:Uncharacterised protein [Yersinia frederiksenii]|nr:Uncharacterised protein [Yersinia frederiksenii]CNG87678.1 Uncharacterised protein [Yersinia frederiksenii]CNM02624.1 Uncharacterised protein [Yersinia frederiksenii]CQH60747.1 Uncharacterised protein [Yersinia frederiksenii]CQJ05143.1 Uncharacterised protein [Yersinia frederiksenii]